MYDFGSSDSEYSYEYSDVEYNTLDPYDYDLNSFKTEREAELTPEEKLLEFLNNGDLNGVKSILPGMVKLQDEVKVCDEYKNVSENGDGTSDYSGDEMCESDEDRLPSSDKSKLKEILIKGGDTPLMVAIAAAHTDLVEYILSLGVDVNYCVTNSNKCALLALTSNVCVGWRYINNSWRLEAPKCLKMLIDAGANVKVKGFLTTQESGYTAIHYAAQSNYWEMLELLIHAGADVDALSNQRESALMISASKGFVSCCNILLLAGANTQLTDRSGSNAAYLAGIEGHKTLSDSINVFSGSAQHRVELYKIWSQYTQKDVQLNYTGQTTLDITDNLSNTCIESFCLAFDAPDLITVLKEQGITISDLKLMNGSKLKEIGVSEKYIDKIMLALQDVNRNTGLKHSKISFEYGKPLKMVSVLEMIGNMSEHLELVDTNLDCWYSHLTKKYQWDNVLRRVTVDKIRASALSTVKRVEGLREKLRELKCICEKRKAANNNITSLSIGDDNEERRNRENRRSRWSVFGKMSLIGVVSLVTASVTAAFISRRIR